MDRVKSAFFGVGDTLVDTNTSSLGRGRTPALAINGSNIFVIIYKGLPDDNGLYWRIGDFIDRLRLRGRLKPPGYSVFAHGNNPSVAIMEGTKPVVVVMNDISGRLQYSIGTVRGDTLGFKATGTEFRTHQSQATSPSIAINQSGIAIEVHHAPDGIFWRRGKLEGQTLTWPADNAGYQEPIQLSTAGTRPFVAINNAGTAVAVWEQNGATMYAVGSFETEVPVVGPSVIWATPAAYGSGTRPTVAVLDDLTLIETHQVGTTSLHSRIGLVEELIPGLSQYRRTIEFQNVTGQGNQSLEFDDVAREPQVATNGTLAMTVNLLNGESNVDGAIRGNLCIVFDHANWMADHGVQLGTNTLAGIALPASHDSGATALNVSATQSLPVLGQLLYGARYFDIRPKYKGSLGDTSIDTAKFVTSHHIDSREAAPGGGDFDGETIANVIRDVRTFMLSHRELVILKLSHFTTFNQTIFNALITLFLDKANGIGDYVFIRPADDLTTRLAARPLQSYLLADRGTVLLLADIDQEHHNADYVADSDRDRGLYRYRDWYAADPENGDLRVFDVYSDTSQSYKVTTFRDPDLHFPTLAGSPTPLPQGQLPKYQWYDGLCRGTDTVRSTVNCDLFLLSWTVAPNLPGLEGSARDISRRVNGQLIPFLQLPEYAGKNAHGFTVNLLYTDAVERSRSVDLALIRNGLF
jgi:hypothetical protein